jgi:Dolichyl-phosphate-mannose-protein mannosyltransferase
VSVTTHSFNARVASSGATAMQARTASSMLRVNWPVLTVAVLALLVGSASTYLALQSDLILLYNDSMSHLDVARRVVDSRTPGLVQLGTVWLPVPHMLLLPTVWSHFLWRTGLAGSLVGLACLVVTAVCLFQSIRMITHHQVAAWLGVVVLLTNPNVLYLQSTALTEPVLLATMTASAYFLLRWSKKGSHVDLALAGCCAILAVGSRYDGWFFALACSGLVMLTSWLRSRRFAEAQGVTLAYAVLPLYGMVLWVVYNWIIFGDPLYFQRSEFSAAFQQQRFFVEGKLPTRGSLVISAETYGWAVLENIGVLVAALGTLGIIVYAIRTRLKHDSLIPYAFLSGLPFNVIALVLGQSILMVPTMDPPGYFNIRYGIVVLPGFALFIAYFADVLSRWLRPIVTVAVVATVLLVQVALWLPGWPRSVITIADGLGGLSTKTNPVETAHYLGDRYTGGGILVDDSLVGLIFETGLDLREFVSTGNGEIWRNTLLDPANYVEWVAFRPNEVGDRVTTALADEPALTEHFTQVYAAEGYVLYKRNDADAAQVAPAGMGY